MYVYSAFMFFSLGIGGHKNYMQQSTGTQFDFYKANDHDIRYVPIYKTIFLVKQTGLNIDNTVFTLWLSCCNWMSDSVELHKHYDIQGLTSYVQFRYPRLVEQHWY